MAFYRKFHTYWDEAKNNGSKSWLWVLWTCRHQKQSTVNSGSENHNHSGSEASRKASQSLWLKSFKKSFTLTLVQKLQVKLHNYSGWKASRKASHLLLLKSFKLTETLVKKRSSSVSWGGGRRKYIISCHFDRWHVCKLYVKRLKIRYDYCHFTSITICDFVITW